MARSCKMNFLRVLMGLAVISCSTSPLQGAAEPEETIPQFGSARVCIHTSTATVMLPVEVAVDAAQRAQGLMDREHLAADSGMLFIFPEPQSASNTFWMYRTRIPLDIAFINAEGVIVSVRHMQPCLSQNPWKCPTYSADVIFKAALEVNQGFFAAHAVAEGDRVILADAGNCTSSRDEYGGAED
jgi:uncharacterized membrane protein (UPF0127 family)